MALALISFGQAWGESKTISWAVSSAPDNSGIISHANSDALQIAFGTAINNEANDWKVVDGNVTVSYNSKSYSFSKYATTSNVNGSSNSSLAANGSSTYNYIAFVPKYDGTLILVGHNLGTGSTTKPTWCYEDGVVKSGVIIGSGSSNIAYDGQSDVKTLNGNTAVTGGIKITVSANKLYTFSVQGSKARWSGVIYEYEEGAKTSAEKTEEKSGLHAYLDNAGSISDDKTTLSFTGYPMTVVGENIQAGNAQYQFVVNTKNYTGVKFAANKTYIVKPSKGVNITGVKAYDSSNSDNTAGISSGEKSIDLNKRGTKNTPVTMEPLDLTTNSDGEFYFTITGTQSIIVLDVTYNMAENIDVKVSSAGYATLYYDKRLAIPAGVTAYTAELNSEKNKVTLNEVSGVIPASTAVILEAAEGTYNFVVTTDAAGSITGKNDLKGTTTTMAVEANSVYTLGQDSEDDVVGLRQYSGTSVRAYSAYLDGTDVATSRLALVFGNETTAVKSATAVAEGSVRKVLRGGRLVIETANGVYNVTGTQVK